jgi:polyisoprenoid-binding protein YceI
MHTTTIGPEHGTLTLSTGVEGRAARAGHALTILLTDWAAVATLDGPSPSAVTFRAALASMEVVSGEGGVKPLSEGDRRTIRDNALATLGAARHPEVTFESRSVTARGDGYDVEGTLTVSGTALTRAVHVSVQRGDGTASVLATAPVVQTEFGVRPYSALMGGLRVRDRVDVRLAAQVPEPV